MSEGTCVPNQQLQMRLSRAAETRCSMWFYGITLSTKDRIISRAQSSLFGLVRAGAG